MTHDEDEVLFALAEELGNLSTYIAGSPNILVTYLETLAAMEETVVRNQAVKSLRVLTD